MALRLSFEISQALGHGVFLSLSAFGISLKFAVFLLEFLALLIDLLLSLSVLRRQVHSLLADGLSFGRECVEIGVSVLRRLVLAKTCLGLRHRGLLFLLHGVRFIGALGLKEGSREIVHWLSSTCGWLR